MSVADTVDALSHNRPYRVSIPVHKIVAELRRERGLQFDPVVVDAMLASGWQTKVAASPPHPWPRLTSTRMAEIGSQIAAQRERAERSA